MVCGAAVLSGSALAESLQEKVQWRDDVAAAESARTTVKDKCETEVTFDFDKPAFATWDWTKRKPHERCQRVFTELGYICGKSPEGKLAVQSKVKAVVCTVRANGAPEVQSLKAGTLLYSIDPSGHNNAQDSVLLKRALSPGLELAERWAGIERPFVEETKRMNTVCGTTLTLEVDRASFAKRMDDRYNASLCDVSISALESRCKDEAGRTGAAKIKHIVCRASERETSGFASVKAGALIFEVGKGGGRNETEIIKWLGDHL